MDDFICGDFSTQTCDDESDIQELIDRLRNWVDQNCDGSSGDEIKACIEENADKNQDGQIDKEELKDFLHDELDYDFWIKLRAKKIIEFYDKDYDGMLNDEELEQMLKDGGFYLY